MFDCRKICVQIAFALLFIAVYTISVLLTIFLYFATDALCKQSITFTCTLSISAAVILTAIVGTMMCLAGLQLVKLYKKYYFYNVVDVHVEFDEDTYMQTY